MDFIDELNALASKIEKTKDSILTEEACKSAYVMPFLKNLGYDVFNPLEVVPEYTTDVGTKKGEKVDYAIFKDENPIILIECKSCTDCLTNHDSQLYRYFSVSNAKFAILTNGILYKFFTDLEEPNKMDKKPFLEFDLLNIKENLVSEIKKFHKQSFNIEDVFSSASELKYTKEIKSLLNKDLMNPSDIFVKYFASQVYSGRLTQQVVEKFSHLTKKAFNQLVNDLINERLQSAIVKETEENDLPQINQAEQVESIDNKIETTLEELEGYAIVKSILISHIPPERINYRDYVGHFAIHLDTNPQKIICKLFFNAKDKAIGIRNEDRKDVRYSLASLNDIYLHSEKLILVLNNFLTV